MVFGHKPKLHVDLEELPAEKEHLTSFLQATLKIPVNAAESKVFVESQNMPPKELKRIVTKFIYKRNLNNSYYVSLEGSTVKVHALKGTAKKRNNKKDTSRHQTAAQSWGL